MVRFKTQIKPDYDRNIPLDADQLFAVNSLMTAHAGLIVLFPDINNITTEFERYKELSTGATEATGYVLDAVLDKLAETEDIFDDDTHITMKQVVKLRDLQGEQSVELKGIVATKHSWLRGSLAAMGAFLLKSSRAAAPKLIDEELKEVIKNQTVLRDSIISFLASAKPNLVALATSLEPSFGWLRHLFDYIKHIS